VRSYALAAAITLAAAGCSRAAETSVDSTGGSEPAATARLTPSPDSAAMASAIATLGAFLDASREGSATRDDLVRLTSCPGSGDPLPGPMLAAHEILPAATRGDTVIGRAVVTTVAEQDVDRRHPGYFVARVRVRADTLEWDIVPTGEGAWVVCNGLSFGLTAPDSLTAWRPDGASYATARALADSISRMGDSARAR
jgi:hypothetical protein